MLYPLENRLARYILEAYSTSSSQDENSESLTHISELLGTSYRHLLRVLDKFCSENIIKKSIKKLSESTVISICDYLEKTDLTIDELSKKYSVPKGKIESIRYGNSWVYISNNYDFSKRNKYKKG